MALLQAFDLYRFYHTEEDETLDLRGVSLNVEPGEIVVVMGPSGSGKSTLLNCLAGLDEPDGGHVELLGKRLSRRPEAARAAMRAEGIGIHLQSGNLFEHLNVEDNIRLQMKLARKEDSHRIEGLLETVGLLPRRNSLPSELSGGEAARAGLAVAMSASPQVLLADEPTGQVDAETERLILKVFATHRSQGGATLIVTHSDAVATLADRLILLRDGRVDNVVSNSG